MRVTLQNTTKQVILNGVPVRIWEGKTDSGIPCHAYIALIGVARDLDSAEFDREIEEQMAPSEAVLAIPLRMIL